MPTIDLEPRREGGDLDRVRIRESFSGIGTIDRALTGATCTVVSRGVDSDGEAYVLLEAEGVRYLAYEDQLLVAD